MPNGKTCYIILLKNNAVTATEVRYTEKEPKQKADILKDEVQNDWQHHRADFPLQLLVLATWLKHKTKDKLRKFTCFIKFSVSPIFHFAYI